MFRRAATALARQQATLQEVLQAGQASAPACRALQQARALHPALATRLAEASKPPGAESTSTGSDIGPEAASAAQQQQQQQQQQQHVPPAGPAGATESVFFGAVAKAAAESHAKASTGVPGITTFLGFAGALPFWVFSPTVAQQLPLDLLVDPQLLASPGLLQVGYGATILSFLGGVHWGLAMTNVGGALGYKMAEQRFIWSVLPCLMAWPTVAMPVGQAAGIQVALLAAVYAVDRSWASKGLLPPWYMKMRLPLTLLAAGGLALTAATV